MIPDFTSFCRRSWDETGCSSLWGRRHSVWASRKPRRPSTSMQSAVLPTSTPWRSTGRAWRSTWRTGQRSPARGFSTWTALTAGWSWVSLSVFVHYSPAVLWLVGFDRLSGLYFSVRLIHLNMRYFGSDAASSYSMAHQNTPQWIAFRHLIICICKVTSKWMYHICSGEGVEK